MSLKYSFKRDLEIESKWLFISETLKNVKGMKSK